VIHCLVCICCYNSHHNLCHRPGKNHPPLIELMVKGFYSLSSISFGNYYLFLLMCFPFMASEPSFCDLCVHTTWAGNVVTRTLLFHTYHSCAGSTVLGSCIHNYTIYSVCSHSNQHICFNSTYHPREQWVEIRSARNPGTLSAAPRSISLINQCQCSLMHVQPRQGWIWRYRLGLWGPSLGKSLYVKW
jgi:hypothetical protein